MFEHAIYSVISPEGASSILWHTADKAPDAAEAMKITAIDLQRLGIVDRIVAEPMGGAQRDPVGAIAALGAALAQGAEKVVVIDFDVGLRNLDLVMGAERRVVYDLVTVVQGLA